MLVVEDMLRKGLVDDPHVYLDQFSFNQITKGVPRSPQTHYVSGSQKANLDNAFESFNGFLSEAFLIKLSDRSKFDTLVFSNKYSFTWDKELDYDS